MRSVRGNANQPKRVGEPVNNFGVDDATANKYQIHSSSEDEDELTQLKPNLQSHKHKQQQQKGSKKKGSKKAYKNGIFQEPDSHVTNPNLQNYILSGGQYEDTLSPNEGENTYAEASLLPSSMLNPLNRQDNRYEQGT